MCGLPKWCVTLCSPWRSRRHEISTARPCTHQSFSAHHDKNDNNDKVSINLCQSLSWATFQIPCHSCHLCHSTKGSRYFYPFVMNTGSDSTCKWACQWRIKLPQTATVCGYLLPTPICVTTHVLYLRTGVWFLPTHLVDTCICNRSFPSPEDFWLTHKLTYRMCLLTVASWYVDWRYC